MTVSRKILTIGYYADFSRFFKRIADETKKINHNIEFLHVDLFLSGYLYSVFNGQKSVYLPCQKSKAVQTTDVRDDDFYRQFIVYHQRLLPSLNEGELIAQAKKYYHYFNELLSDYQPDLIIVSGDSRMPAEIVHHLALEKDIKIACFEQAPLGRTILDLKGVNANSSFRYLDPQIIEASVSDDYHLPPQAKWKKYKFFRVVDLVVEKFLPFLVPVEQRRPVRHKINNKQYADLLETKSLVAESHPAAKKLLLVLQVPDDVNMIYHSPWFSSHYQIVKQVTENLPENTLLVVREHPLFRQLYEPEMYKYISENDKVFFDNSGSLDQAISQSDLVVVNNSTVGLESIEKGKKVVVLGNSYYDASSLCYKYQGDNLNSLITDALNGPAPDEVYRKKYLSYLFNHVFIRGHFRDLDGPAPGEIAKWIIKNV
ncbi:capsular polysaccharide export protein, LipB/KpsS family [Erwinia sorbitola]|uniref:Capsular biosynthesis protein n=1 Tax=Erwinia sorbitola TaxID=2681984 RepID=A0A6I6EB79_9GAMM|nr:hypothetical protein [Erwinia sorbitola]MTD26396.1 hypothetical protein [Erwinia sorbitola]QGU87017.1 hypothetical protein GN242_07215 [Erwinia sorbitola]